MNSSHTVLSTPSFSSFSVPSLVALVSTQPQAAVFTAYCETLNRSLANACKCYYDIVQFNQSDLRNRKTHALQLFNQYLGMNAEQPLQSEDDCQQQPQDNELNAIIANIEQSLQQLSLSSALFHSLQSFLLQQLSTTAFPSFLSSSSYAHMNVECLLMQSSSYKRLLSVAHELYREEYILFWSDHQAFRRVCLETHTLPFNEQHNKHNSQHTQQQQLELLWQKQRLADLQSLNGKYFKYHAEYSVDLHDAQLERLIVESVHRCHCIGCIDSGMLETLWVAKETVLELIELYVLPRYMMKQKMRAKRRLERQRLEKLKQQAAELQHSQQASTTPSKDSPQHNSHLPINGRNRSSAVITRVDFHSYFIDWFNPNLTESLPQSAQLTRRHTLSEHEIVQIDALRKQMSVAAQQSLQMKLSNSPQVSHQTALQQSQLHPTSLNRRMSLATRSPNANVQSPNPRALHSPTHYTRIRSALNLDNDDHNTEAALSDVAVTEQFGALTGVAAVVSHRGSDLRVEASQDYRRNSQLRQMAAVDSIDENNSLSPILVTSSPVLLRIPSKQDFNPQQLQQALQTLTPKPRLARGSDTLPPPIPLTTTTSKQFANFEDLAYRVLCHLVKAPKIKRTAASMLATTTINGTVTMNTANDDTQLTARDRSNPRVNDTQNPFVSTTSPTASITRRVSLNNNNKLSQIVHKESTGQFEIVSPTFRSTPQPTARDVKDNVEHITMLQLEDPLFNADSTTDEEEDEGLIERKKRQVKFNLKLSNSDEEQDTNKHKQSLKKTPSQSSILHSREKPQLIQLFQRSLSLENELLLKLQRGCRMIKYNANATQSDKWFFVSADGSELCYGNVDEQTKGLKRSLFFFDNRVRKMPLAECLRIKYSSKNSERFERFTRQMRLKRQLPWLCLSIIFADGRCLDVVCENENQVADWILGLQFLTPMTQFNLTRAGILWRRCQMKIKYRAEQQHMPLKLIIQDMIRDARDNKQFKRHNSTTANALITGKTMNPNNQLTLKQTEQQKRRNTQTVKA